MPDLRASFLAETFVFPGASGSGMPPEIANTQARLLREALVSILVADQPLPKSTHSLLRLLGGLASTESVDEYAETLRQQCVSFCRVLDLPAVDFSADHAEAFTDDVSQHRNASHLLALLDQYPQKGKPILDQATAHMSSWASSVTWRSKVDEAIGALRLAIKGPDISMTLAALSHATGLWSVPEHQEKRALLADLEQDTDEAISALEQETGQSVTRQLVALLLSGLQDLGNGGSLSAIAAAGDLLPQAVMESVDKARETFHKPAQRVVSWCLRWVKYLPAMAKVEQQMAAEVEHGVLFELLSLGGDAELDEFVSANDNAVLAAVRKRHLAMVEGPARQALAAAAPTEEMQLRFQTCMDFLTNLGTDDADVSVRALVASFLGDGPVWRQCPNRQSSGGGPYARRWSGLAAVPQPAEPGGGPWAGVPATPGGLTRTRPGTPLRAVLRRLGG
ncbi:MAG: hypothetical protein GY772_07715 [bacterium]|nr:hypothetical protein [bacterium]